MCCSACYLQLLLVGYFSHTADCGDWCVFAGSAITGPVAKECADLWPRIASAANSIV